jgi:hypothetical protein
MVRSVQDTSIHVAANYQALYKVCGEDSSISLVANGQVSTRYRYHRGS